MADTNQFNYADKAMPKGTVPGPESSKTGSARSKNAVAATNLQACRDDSSYYSYEESAYEESVSDTQSEVPPNRGNIRQARARESAGKVDCSIHEGIEEIEAIGSMKRLPPKLPQLPRTRGTQLRTQATAVTRVGGARRNAVADRSRRKAVVTVSRNMRRLSSRSPERSRKTNADAAKNKKQGQSSSSSPPPPCSFVERKFIKPRADLQHKQRVVEPAFGDSSSEDQRACRSRGAPVKGSLKYGRVHESVQPARRRDDGHTRHQRRGTQDLQKKRARWTDVRSRSPVDARSCRKPLPRSSSSVSPPKKAPSESPPKKARLIPARRPQSRTSVALSQERYVELEERAEPLASVPWRLSNGFSAESTTWALDSVRSRPPWQSSLRRVNNLMFLTSYVAESADLACFTKWLGEMGHHCNVILCQSKKSAVAGWLMQCSNRGCTEEQEKFLARGAECERRVVFVTAGVYLVLKTHRVECARIKEIFHFDDTIFAVAEMKLHDRCAKSMHEHSTTVGLGVSYNVLPQSRMMPESIMEKMCESVVKHDVRCFTGTFGLDGKQMASFASKFPMATGRPLCQTWLGRDGHTEYVFPCYTLLLGNSTNASTTSKLLESEVAVKNKWVSTVYPYEEVMPQWRKMPPAQVDESGAYDIDWGHVKEKKMDPARWIPHMHQVFWWCGTATQGDGARSRMQEGRHMPPKRELPCDRSCGHASSSSKTNPQFARRKANPWPDMKDWQ